MTSMNKTTIVLGVMVAGIAGGIFAAIYSSGNIASLSGDNDLQKSAEDGSFKSSDSPLSPTINKEQWHQDPFAELAKQVRDGKGTT